MFLKLYCHIFRTLIYLMAGAYLKPCQIYKMIRHIETPAIARTSYSGIFANNEPCSGMLRRIKAYWGIFKHYWGISERFRTLCKPCIYNCAILRTQAHLKPEVSSKVCKTCKMIRHIRSPGTVRTFYSSLFKGMIFRDINLYSATLRCSTKEKGGSLCRSFLKIKKSAWFWKKKNTDYI